ncbi:MAG: hypothetical protein KatS3mg022_0310 [Armatimonadota bacterium]|nr:MAG: hypothetical protein KatS3mg022_0310 [Armatimonadota bacterium]
MKTGDVNPHSIPDALKRVPNWVVWRYETREGKQTKVPKCPHAPERNASVSDPNTWADFRTALKASTRCDGVGFVLTPEVGITAFDFDQCLREDGTCAPDVWELVRILDSYTEVTPSGRGLRVLCYGKLPDGRRRRGSLEMYCDSRFVTVTGRHMAGTPQTIEFRQAEIERVHRMVFGDENEKPAPAPAPATDLTDSELLAKAMHAANGEKFKRLWEGDDTGYPSASEADCALMSMLLFWTAGDVARAERLFSSSPRGQREKWQRRDYRRRTIEAALAHKTTFYEPHQRNGHDHEHTDAVRVMTKFVPRRFTEKILHLHRFYSCGDLRTGDFYRYDQQAGVWREDAEAFLANLLREDGVLPEEWKKETCVREVIADIRELCWHESPLPTPPPTLIPFANGVFDLHTGELRGYTPEDGFTSKLPWRYDPDAHSELLAVRLGAFPEAIRTHFWEFLAYCLWRGYPLQRAFFWIGKASAGKSYLMKMLMTALGTENVANVTLHDLGGNRFAVAQLHRKLLAFSGELRYDDLAQTDTLKSLTGGDLLTADRKYREPVTFRNHAKLLFTGNALPLTHDRTDAFYRRAFIVRFEHQFAEDPRIETELDLLPPDVKAREFAWCVTQAVAVLQRLLENGFQMTGDVSVAEKRRMYEELSDPLQTFIAEHCDRTFRTDDYVFKYEFNDRLNEWLQARGMNQYQTRRVNQRMRELGYEEAQKGERKWWAWIGICWKNDPPVTEVTEVTISETLYETSGDRFENTVTSVTSVTPQDGYPVRGWCGVCQTTTVHRPYRLSNGMVHWQCVQCATVRLLEVPDG